jgi:predicted GNAT superfamily acetyltransferase
MTPEQLGFIETGPNGWAKTVRDSGVIFRSLTDFADFAPIEQLQREVMGTTDLDIFPASGLIVVPETGGHVLAAYLDGELAGALYGFGGFHHGTPRVVSDWMGVWPRYRSAGIGAELKTLQAAIASMAGFREVVWTVDPLRAANARLNFEKLGAYSDHYEENRYGEDYAAGLYGGLPTDRLHMTLPLTDRAVEARLTGRIPPRTAEDIAGVPRFEPGIAVDRALINLPSDIDQLVATDLTAAISWRYALRTNIQAALAEGFVIRGFIPATAERGALSAYLIERDEGHASG